MADDFDLDDLFRDEFKPDFSHTLESIKEHKAPVNESHIFDSIGEMPTVNDIYTQLAENSAEMLYPTEDISLNGDGPSEQEERDNDEALAELRLKLTGTFYEPDEFDDEDDIQEEIDEVLSGEVVAYEPAAIDTVAIEGTVVEEDSTVTDLSNAVAELERVRAMKIDNDAQKNAIRAKINETQRILDGLKAELTTHDEKTWEIRRKEHEAETKVSEEAHIEAEKKREADIQKERKHAMMQFHSHIEELAPEWKDYAFDHQWEGASTLALHESGLLADEMGLGKTLSAIMYLDMVKAERVLVVTPNDTCSNFTLELAMWAKHRFVWSLAGADKKAREVFMDMILKPRVEEGKDLTLTVNFEQLYTDTDYFNQLMEMGFDTIVVDEAHNFKEKKSLLFQRLKALKNSGIKRILPMTGTFILNKPTDIWPALHLIDSEAFPTEKQFTDHYCEYNYYTSKWEFRPGGEKSMLIRLGGRIVKRSMEEAGIVLPEMHFHEIDLDFPENGYEDQKNIMRQLADHSQIILDSDRKVSIVEQIALITRQRQCAVWPAGITIKDPETEEVLFSVGDEVRESIKLDWVESKVRELKNGGKRIAVFSQFKTALAELERRLIDGGFRVVRYDGDTDKSTKALVKRDFDRRHVEKTGDYQWDIVLCNFKTGGVGLNFTHATEMVMLDEEWNPGKNNQAYARVHRIGQTEEQNVWIPRLSGSIDKWMKALNDQKRDLIAGFDSEVDLQKEFSDFLATVRENV